MSDLCEASSPHIPVVVTPSESEHSRQVPARLAAKNVKQHAHGRVQGPASRRTGYFAMKSVVDRTVTALLMVVALPLMLLIGLAVLVFDGRPVFFRQTRVGKDGRTFRIWKFRTMCCDAECKTGVVWSSAGDPRVTALGRWLRSSHLDELPQFFNVLAGDMNLIGPRPERPEFVRELALEWPYYQERLNVRPGITGLAQLQLGYDQSLADVERKVLLDLEYIRNISVLQDVKILLATIPYIAGKVIRRWQAGPATLDDDTKTGTVFPFGRDDPTRVRRSDLPNRVKWNLHFIRCRDGFESDRVTSSDAVVAVHDVAGNYWGQAAGECQ